MEERFPGFFVRGFVELDVRSGEPPAGSRRAVVKRTELPRRIDRAVRTQLKGKRMIDALIGEKRVSRDAVLAWEDRRFAAVARRLGLRDAGAYDRDARRRALSDRKAALGHAGIRRLLARDLVVSNLTTRLMLALSRGARRFSVCELVVETGSAERFASWFDGAGSKRTNVR